MLSDSPIVVWIQISREIWECDKCKQVDRKIDTFQITLILNDYPIGTLNNIEDTKRFLKHFFQNEEL